MRVLFIANARRKGGLSGSDAIYEAFLKHWDCDITVSHMIGVDFKPFILCYIYRIISAIFSALVSFKRYDLVYSCSDFWMDSLPAFIYKLKGAKWVAGFFLKAPKENKPYYYSQLIIQKLITKFADMVIVTNPTMYDLFPEKNKTWINGVIHTEYVQKTQQLKVYDAVFCGRIHPTKGIDELIRIWQLVRKKRPDAKLAVIGDGDLGITYMWQKLDHVLDGVTYFGFQGNKRYDIFSQSKVVLYPTPFKYDHFSIAPVEAMACGCPIICFDTKVIRYFEKHLGLQGGAACQNEQVFAEMICSFIDGEWKDYSEEAKEWAGQFDEPIQAKRVLTEIKERLFNEDSYDGERRHGGCCCASCA